MSIPPRDPKRATEPTITGTTADGQTVLTATAATKPGDAAPATRVTLAGDQVKTHLSVGGTKTGTPGTGSGTSGTHLGQVWGDFKFDRLLGKGGMGAVYLGRQLSLDRPVAIKVLPAHLSENEQFRERFQLEARAVARINSPHVIQVFAAGVHEGHSYFAMEYVEGDDLSRRLRAGYKPSYREALSLVTQAARGLAAAGEHGIVHRDIKPGNMMITTKGVLKIMDFGLVKLAGAAHSLTMTGTVMGTVSYFSPEQGRGENCDQRTDIYALGVVFYEMLTGRLPFSGDNATSVIYQHIHVAPKPLIEIDPNIPAGYQAVVHRCMQKDADRRYASAVEMLVDLESLAEGKTVAASDQMGYEATIVGGVARGTAKPKGGSSRIAAGAGIAAVLVAACGGIWFATQSPKPVVAPAPDPIAAAPVVAKPPADPIPDARPAVPDKPVEIAKPVELPKPVEATKPVEIAKPVELPKPVEPAPVEVVPPPAEPKPTVVVNVVTDQAKALPAIERARRLLNAHELVDARKLAREEAVAHPEDPSWKSMLAQIDAAAGMDELKAARAALGRGELEVAARAAASAETLIPNHPDLLLLTKELAMLQAERQRRTRAVQEAESLLVEERFNQAEELLAKLAVDHPADAEISALLRRAKAGREKAELAAKLLNEQLAQADAALARRDLDGALIGYTMARQSDPRNQRAATGVEAVFQAKNEVNAVRIRFEDALRARSLATAERELARLRELVPGSATVLAAERAFADSRLIEDEKRREAERIEQERARLAAAVLKRVDDPAADVATMERELASFLAKAGNDRPERPELERKIEDRRTRIAVDTVVVAIDQSVAKGSASDLAATIDDTDFVKALDLLKRYPGLVFESKVVSFTRKDDQATAEVDIRHALAVMPERTLRYVFQLRRASGAWRVAAATLQKQP